MKKTLVRLVSPAPTSRRLFGTRLGGSLALLAALGAVGFFASSRPAHTAGGAIAVNVAAAVPLHDADNPAQQPFQIHLQPSAASGGQAESSFTVPTGKALVIESLSSAIIPQNNTGGGFVELLTTAAGVTVPHYLQDTHFTPSRQNLLTRLYADPGTVVTARTFSLVPSSGVDPTTLPAGADVELSGYYVTVP